MTRAELEAADRATLLSEIARMYALLDAKIASCERAAAWHRAEAAERLAADDPSESPDDAAWESNSTAKGLDGTATWCRAVRGARDP